jgi:hypothetical protein
MRIRSAARSSCRKKKEARRPSQASVARASTTLKPPVFAPYPVSMPQIATTTRGETRWRAAIVSSNWRFSA